MPYKGYGIYALLVNVLDVGGEHTSLHIGTAGRKEHVVGVPVDGQDRRADGLLEQTRNPPVVVGIEGANRDGPINISVSVSG